MKRPRFSSQQGSQAKKVVNLHNKVIMRTTMVPLNIPLEHLDKDLDILFDAMKTVERE